MHWPTSPPMRSLAPLSRDGYATAILRGDGATLSLDFLAASEPAVQRMGEAACQLCEQLVAEWPGSRIAATSVARLPRR